MRVDLFKDLWLERRRRFAFGCVLVAGWFGAAALLYPLLADAAWVNRLVGWFNPLLESRQAYWLLVMVVFGLPVIGGVFALWEGGGALQRAGSTSFDRLFTGISATALAGLSQSSGLPPFGLFFVDGGGFSEREWGDSPHRKSTTCQLLGIPARPIFADRLIRGSRYPDGGFESILLA